MWLIAPERRRCSLSPRAPQKRARCQRQQLDEEADRGRLCPQLRWRRQRRVTWWGRIPPPFGGGAAAGWRCLRWSAFSARARAADSAPAVRCAPESCSTEPSPSPTWWPRSSWAACASNASRGTNGHGNAAAPWCAVPPSWGGTEESRACGSRASVPPPLRGAGLCEGTWAEARGGCVLVLFLQVLTWGRERI